jgi:hypothetical protein
MKTLHTTNAANTNPNPKLVHSLMTVAGIIIAILCSLFLLHDAAFVKHLDVKIPSVLESSRTVAADLLLEVKTWL